ncbi:acetyltransferase [Pseudoalteromonas sp. MMG013]|uniref:acetyltransferase n=1 Tax=Pseudoalteromonas sp. MMG013 TaxID=2822687 RepID=UPI001B35A64D|nr:acetyltransferase [Pseudoalteromonas sp. MMG013]MBQ4863795.1 acetyltransferase [Pseudoalteromonas sp. MMG013]
MAAHNMHSHSTALNKCICLSSEQLGTVVFNHCLIVHAQHNIASMQEPTIFINEIFHYYQHINYLQFKDPAWQSNPASQQLGKHINIFSFSRYEFYNCPELLLFRPNDSHFKTFPSTISPMGQPYLADKLLYKRRDRDINHTISFKVIDPESDLALFHQWMNNPRVAQF